MKKVCVSSVVKVALIIIVLIIVLFPLLWTIISMIIIGNEENACKKELNNAFINADYPGWHMVELSNGNTIMLPDGWSIKISELLAVITDKNGVDVAKGGEMSMDGESAYRHDLLLSNLLGYPVSVATKKPEKSVRASQYGKIVLTDDSSKEYCYIFLSGSGADDMFFLLEPTVNETHSDITEILEAMIFSYVWK